MKSLIALSLSFLVLPFLGCQTSPASTIKPSKVEVSGPIELTKYYIDQPGTNKCIIRGELKEENGDPLIGATVQLDETNLGAVCDVDGTFVLDNVPAGNHTLKISWPGMGTCTVSVALEQGDRLTLEALFSFEDQIQLEKPVIYLYPEEKTEVQVGLAYDGKITTTYPKLSKDGWKIQAEPDGTLTDQKGREYYSLYWEGKPRQPLGMTEGFVVPKDRAIEFLEEKLEFLGLNAREANEFIIYWLPALEKNEYNLISFAGEEYLDQAKLNISPKPDTEIRICMIFHGLDGEIDFPLQDLTPLRKERKGFTIVEWGGQQLPKGYAQEI
jgi:hypothetical protein